MVLYLEFKHLQVRIYIALIYSAQCPYKINIKQLHKPIYRFLGAILKDMVVVLASIGK